MQYHWPKGYCPFGCHNADPELGLESQFDVNGYCQHLVGTLNLAPGAKATGKLFETLEPIMVPVYDENDRPIVEVIDGKQVPRLAHSGNMRSNGKKRQPVLETDVVIDAARYQKEVTYIQQQTDLTGAIQETIRKPKLGIVARVYRKDANVPVIVKPQDDDAAQEHRNKADEMMLAAEEHLARAKLIDKAREPSQVDEIAAAAAEARAESARMKENKFATVQS